MVAKSPFSEPDIQKSRATCLRLFLSRPNVYSRAFADYAGKRAVTYDGRLVKEIILDNSMLQESVLDIVFRLPRQRAQQWFLMVQSAVRSSVFSSPVFAKALYR